MTVAKIYLVFSAAINTADFLFVICLAGTAAVNADVYYLHGKASDAVITGNLLFYGLFAVPIPGRQGIALSKSQR